MSNHALHRHTPTLQVCDTSGSPVRSVAYYRRSLQDGAQPRVTASATQRAGRITQHWDPRLFALSAVPTANTANLNGLTSLSGRPLLTESVDAGWHIQLWGATGELQVGWDGRGTRTRHSYDALLRPIAVFEQRLDATECCIGLTAYGTQSADSVAHNQCGQPVRVDDSAGRRQVHGYSLLGAALAETRHFLQELTAVDWPQAVEQRDVFLEPEGATTCWRYDALGALLQQIDAQGNVQSTDYNIAGQIAGTRLQLHGQLEQTVIRNITYNAFGQFITETAGNGVTHQATYRPDTGALLRLVARRSDKTCLQDLQYDYDPVGNVVSITDATQALRHFANTRVEPVNTYDYDTLSQLIKATGREVGSNGYGPERRTSSDPTQLVNYTQTYDYDAAGNLHTLHHHGAQHYTRTMQTAERSNRSLVQKADGPLLDTGAIDAGFDANGNVQHLQPGQVLQWDGRNQLCQVTPVVRDEGPDDTEHYIYDGGGQRLRKVRISQAKAVCHIAQVRYLPGLEIREDSASGETLHVISLQSPGRISARVLHWEVTPKGVSNDQLRYGLGDHLGSSTLELDNDAQLVSQEGYYPYGGTAWWAAKSQAEVKYKTIRYSGKECDATGLYYYGFRYYAPGWGRWLNPDPAGTVDGLNVYRMVRNNPMILIDEQGLSPTKKEGVLYAPFYSTDMVDQALGSNTTRQARGKPLRMLIAPDNEVMESLNYYKSVFIEGMQLEISKIENLFESKGLKHKLSVDMTSAGEGKSGEKELDEKQLSYPLLVKNVEVLSGMKIASNSGGGELSKLTASGHKIYVLGHGGAGRDLLGADQNMEKGMVTSEDVAKQFSDGGLPNDFQDVRTTACYSADATKPTSFKMPLGKRISGLISSVLGRAPSEVPFAKSLSNALKKTGFSKVQVTGYHAAGVTFSSTEHHSRRIITKDGNVDRRRSLAAKKF